MKFGPAVDAVHELQGTAPITVDVLPALLQPVPEAGRLLGEADAQQAVQRERSVADPGVTVVPVAFPADRLGQAASRGRDDGPRRLEGEKLEREGGALNHGPPAAGIGALRQPAPPERNGVAEKLLRVVRVWAVPGAVLGADEAQHERNSVSFAEREVGGHPVAVDMQRDRGGQAEAQARPVKAGAPTGNVDLVGAAGIVEGRTALESKLQPTPNHTDSSDQFIRHGARAAHGHVVLHLAHALGVEEAGDEDVGVRPVELLVAEWVADRGDPEASTLGVVQDGGEDARGIEVR